MNGYDKNKAAPFPPMGWNSWDCYGASVTEEQLIGNARYMAEHLKEFGWEYVVCDIQWYEPAAKSDQYNAFAPLEMDEYSRLIPAANRFPSAENGQGFTEISRQIHDMGLKFGIHIMRGIPRQAVHGNCPIKYKGKTAKDIAASFSVCSWNTDMYGVNPDAEGAQEYYDSLFELYASWGVDYVKVDDICVTKFKPHDPYSAKREIELIRNAIDKCGREMVLSLSPGPASTDNAEHLKKHANMWRLTDDFWDSWNQLYEMFNKCHEWSGHVSTGCWPDCDMLPIGRIAINNDQERKTERLSNFTKDEQITLMTLWCVFRSPLMLGCELRDLDEWTLTLITNPEVLWISKHTGGALQKTRLNDTIIVWETTDADGNEYYAFFNTSDEKYYTEIPTSGIITGKFKVRDLWIRQDIDESVENIRLAIEPHGARLIKLVRCEN